MGFVTKYRVFLLTSALVLAANFAGLTGFVSAKQDAGVIVTMGDSYEVGVESGKPNLKGCKQQDIQSSKIVANSLGMVSQNVACAGDKSGELLTMSRNETIPQINALNQPNIKAVIVSGGGNDVLLPSQIIPCIAALACGPSNLAYKIAYREVAKLWNDQTKTGSLGTLYSQIRQRTNALVLIEGYPVYVAQKGFRPEAPGCSFINSYERIALTSVMASVNAALQKAARYYNFTYVDPFVEPWYNFSTDDICSVSKTKPVAALEGPVPMHPTLSGVYSRAYHNLDILRTLLLQ